MVEKLLKEALALKAVEGLAGVPKLYGMTKTADPSSMGIVMSFSPGRSLASLRDTMSARSYLTVLMYTCATLLKMHQRGVAHHNLRDEHILIDVSEDGKVRSFTIIAFTRAQRNSGHMEMMIDAEMIRSMVSNVYDPVTTDPHANFYVTRDRMSRIVHGCMSVAQIMAELCSILHDHPVDAPCKQRP